MSVGEEEEGERLRLGSSQQRRRGGGSDAGGTEDGKELAAGGHAVSLGGVCDRTKKIWRPGGVPQVSFCAEFLVGLSREAQSKSLRSAGSADIPNRRSFDSLRSLRMTRFIRPWQQKDALPEAGPFTLAQERGKAFRIRR
jgi:hypothetical protein